MPPSRDGLVKRSRESDARRAVTVRLTPAGRALTARLMDEHTRWIASLTADLIAGEREALSALVAKLWRRTDDGQRASPGEDRHAPH